MKKNNSRSVLARNVTFLMARKDAVSTQSKLATKARLSQATVGRILREGSSASTDTLDSLAKVLGVPPHALLDPGLTEPESIEALEKAALSISPEMSDEEFIAALSLAMDVLSPESIRELVKLASSRL